MLIQVGLPVGDNGMDGGRTQLRDRMLWDAIVELLRGTFDASGDGEAILW